MKKSFSTLLHSIFRAISNEITNHTFGTHGDLKVKTRGVEEITPEDQGEESDKTLDEALDIINVGTILASVHVNRNVRLGRLHPKQLELVSTDSDLVLRPDAKINNKYLFLIVPYGKYQFRTKSPCMISSRQEPNERSRNTVEVTKENAYGEVDFNFSEGAVVQPCHEKSKMKAAQNNEYNAPDVKLSIPKTKEGQFLDSYVPVKIKLRTQSDDDFFMLHWDYTFDPEDLEAAAHENEEGVVKIKAHKGDKGNTAAYKDDIRPEYIIRFGDYENILKHRIEMPLKSKESKKE